MNRARRLKRVFGIEIERCARCGGTLRIIATGVCQHGDDGLRPACRHRRAVRLP
jgi:hypothetical protein